MLDFFMDGDHFEIPNAIEGEATFYSENGILVFADLDGDGTVDQVLHTDFDGHNQVWNKGMWNDLNTGYDRW